MASLSAELPFPSSKCVCVMELSLFKTSLAQLCFGFYPAMGSQLL